MLKVREIFRLTFENQMGVREVARSCSISPTSVSNYLKRYQNGSEIRSHSATG